MAIRINLVNPANIVETAFTRRIQDLHFKDSEIQAAQYLYIEKVLGADFLDYVIANLDDFEELITNFFTPVISYAVYKMNFYRLFAEVTDRGIQQFNNTGTTQIDSEGRAKLYAEIEETLAVKIGMMVDYCTLEAEVLTDGYSLLQINDRYTNYQEAQVFGKTLKNTYL
jgi:hypothetical protein